MSQAEHTLIDADYVLTLEEIANLAEESGNPAETLMNVIALIAKRFQTDVCSAYLLEPDQRLELICLERLLGGSV